MAAAEDTGKYPVWFQYDGNSIPVQLYCNLSILKNFLVGLTNLSYEHVEAARIAYYIESVADAKMKDIVVFRTIGMRGDNLTAELLEVIKCVHPSQSYQCFQIYSKFLSFNISDGNNELVELVLQSVNGVYNKYELLKTQTFRGYPVENACYAGNVTALKTIVKHLSQRPCNQLLPNTAPVYDTGYAKSVEKSQESETEDRELSHPLYSLLQIKGHAGKTPLHYAAERGSVDIVNYLTSYLTNKQWFSLLQITDEKYRTPVHYAANSGKTEAVSCLTHSLTNDQWYSLLNMNDKSYITPVHAAAGGEHGYDMLSALKETVTPEQWIGLLSIPLPNFIHRRDTTARNLSESPTVRNLLEQALIDAKVGQVVLTVNTSEDIFKWETELVEQHPLNREHIKKLSPHSSRYIIPYNQVNSRRLAFIFYSSVQRQGAAEEAGNLEESLHTAGCEVSNLEWSEAIELHNLIENGLNGRANDCSLLIVCIMAHGSRGEVKGCSGKGVPVNDILHQINFNLPKDVPMIMLLQACQAADDSPLAKYTTSKSHDPAPSSLTDPLSNQHITLTRPHTVLLLATVRGGVAYRGVFTGAMADEFRSADGKKDIFAMFNSAAARVAATPGCEGQDPKFESTTKKTLILPPGQ